MRVEDVDGKIWMRRGQLGEQLGGMGFVDRIPQTTGASGDGFDVFGSGVSEKPETEDDQTTFLISSKIYLRDRLALLALCLDAVSHRPPNEREERPVR